MNMAIVLGEAYVFAWWDGEMTGIACRNKGGYVTLRTRKHAFSVPIEDVLRPAGI